MNRLRQSRPYLLLGLLLATAAAVELPSQECCTGSFPICDCGIVCDSGTWACGGGCSPIIIDTKGDGFVLTSEEDGVMFDLGAKGRKRKVSWTARDSNEGFLVLDRNGNGVIDNGTELFGSVTPQPPSGAPNGFKALAVYDELANGGNEDAVIDAKDSIFQRLRIWIDANHNGISEPQELFRLHELGIVSISLNYKESRYVDRYGNQFRYRARVTDSANTNVGKWAYDVFLLFDRSGATTASGGKSR